MLHFDTDYMRGCHPDILRRLTETNLDQTPGYGTDLFTAQARELIKKACDAPEARVFFLVGGTQTNATVIDAVLNHHEGVVCVETGHINVHEAGAVEATGHKVLTLPAHDGKMDPRELKEYIENFYSDETFEHMVAPGMVYISFPTELGTIYSLRELEELSNVCREFSIPLFLDGARLGYGLAASGEVTLKDIARLCDVFYIGGTKVGAMFGEAVVVTDPKLFRHPVPTIKQHGALLAKGRLLGIQFETLFNDDMYLRISRNAVDRAMEMKKGFIEKKYRLFIDSPTNQQFFVLPNEVIDTLREKVSFELWGPRGEKETPVRFVTDWGTRQEDVRELISLL